MFIDLVYDDEIKTYYFDEKERDSGFKYRRPIDKEWLDWNNKATSQKIKRGRLDKIDFDQPYLDQKIWDNCLIEVFGVRDRTGKIFKIDVNNKDRYKIHSEKLKPGEGRFPIDTFRYMYRVITGEDENPFLNENGSGVETQVPFDSQAEKNSPTTLSNT